jgi:hypothetical protein
MALREANKIDLVARTKESSDYMLVIVVDEPWQDSDEFRSLILEKLNNYCSYFLDGQMRREYPDCTQARILVRLSSTEKIPEHERVFLARLADSFKEHGLDIETKELI